LHFSPSCFTITYFQINLKLLELTGKDIDIPEIGVYDGTNLREFNDYCSTFVQNGKTIISSNALKKLKELNVQYNYGLDEAEMFELCKFVLKDITDHQKIIRTRFFETKRKYDTDYVYQDPAEANEELKMKLRENSVKAKAAQKKSRERMLLKRSAQLIKVTKII
jgi:hypothetical protein